jgi:crotonobetainyl-CoA:carnitine CoA-transferase CaiB-like acyl-CoA transferase
MPFPRASQALSRFTVLDLTRVRSGPTCVRQLADWGANVIKIDALLEDAAASSRAARARARISRICTATSGP